MGLGPAAVKLYLELWQRNLLAGATPVIEMGSQELHLSRVRFDGLVRAAGISEYDEQAFADLAYWPGSPRVSARHFYQLLGINEYRCIDLNRVHGAISHDLNLPFDDSSLHGHFGLVTDHGTNEHVFNIAETYRTMHRLCRPGGIMVIVQCVYGGNGFYNFDGYFFEGMAAANNYRILFSSFVVDSFQASLSREERRWENPVTRVWENPIWERALRHDQFHIPLSYDLLTSFNWSKDSTSLGICYAFQKQSDADFQYAYQGEYQAQVQGHSGYQLQFLPDLPSRIYVPLFGHSKEGWKQDVLETTSGKTLVRHLLRRFGLRYLVRHLLRRFGLRYLRKR